MKVIIDPARGGNDTGVSGGGITEKDWNLAISKYIYNILKNKKKKYFYFSTGLITTHLFGSSPVLSVVTPLKLDNLL